MACVSLRLVHAARTADVGVRAAACVCDGYVARITVEEWFVGIVEGRAAGLLLGCSLYLSALICADMFHLACTYRCRCDEGLV